MVKLGELKAGDIILVDDEGTMREGTVVQTNLEEQMVQVNNGIQEFWYEQKDLYPVALDEAQLMKLGFEKENIDGSVKYKKGVFRLVTPNPGDFSQIDMWYREDRRHFTSPLSVHELQNLHADMSKVPLERS